jgi:hypothetical protein
MNNTANNKYSSYLLNELQDEKNLELYLLNVTSYAINNNSHNEEKYKYELNSKVNDVNNSNNNNYSNNNSYHYYNTNEYSSYLSNELQEEKNLESYLWKSI